MARERSLPTTVNLKGRNHGHNWKQREKELDNDAGDNDSDAGDDLSDDGNDYGRKYMFLRPRKGTQLHKHKKRFQVAGSGKTQGEALKFPDLTISKDQDWFIFFETKPLSSLGEVFLGLSNFIPQGHSGPH